MPHDDSLDREADLIMGPEAEPTVAPEGHLDADEMPPPDPCAVALALAWRLRTTEGAARSTLGWAVLGIAQELQPGAEVTAESLGKLVNVKPTTAGSMLRDLARLGVLRKVAALDPATQRAVAHYRVNDPTQWGR